MSKWTKVKGYKNLPVGNWLVHLSEPHLNSDYAVAVIHPNLIMVGGGFGFDLQGDVIAYREIPEFENV